jgi:mycothiol synthase
MPVRDIAAVVPDLQTVRTIADLVDRTSTRRGHAALSEHKRMELDRLGDALDRTGDSAARGPGHPGPAAMIVARENGRPVGYAHLSAYPHPADHAATTPYALEVVVDGDEGGAPGAGGPTVGDDLVGAGIEQVGRLGGGTLRLWWAQATEEDDAVAAAHGFRLERELIQMRCPLPLTDESHTAAHPAAILPTRPFRPGVDEEAWLVTNNRAFATHPEQGNWDLATLLEREQEHWFDPDGFLLYEFEGRLAGSCWTKVHDTTPPMGEIYVIGVDPDFQGRGWGRALTAAGLEWLAARGLRIGMLYVDGDNLAAVSMYRNMGFEPDHVDRAYIREIDRTESTV